MKTFLGVIRYEYRMSIRRLGLWIAFGIVTLPYLSMIQFGEAGSQPLVSNQELWPLLGQIIFSSISLCPWSPVSPSPTGWCVTAAWESMRSYAALA